MQGLVVRQMISEGAIAASHGFRTPICRLVIPELDNLTITPYRNQVYVWKGKDIRGDVLAEVEVPEDLVARAQEILTAQVSILDMFQVQMSPLYGHFGGQ